MNMLWTVCCQYVTCKIQICLISCQLVKCVTWGCRCSMISWAHKNKLQHTAKFSAQIVPDRNLQVLRQVPFKDWKHYIKVQACRAARFFCCTQGTDATTVMERTHKKYRNSFFYMYFHCIRMFSQLCRKQGHASMRENTFLLFQTWWSAQLPPFSQYFCPWKYNLPGWHLSRTISRTTFYRWPLILACHTSHLLFKPD